MRGGGIGSIATSMLRRVPAARSNGHRAWPDEPEVRGARSIAPRRPLLERASAGRARSTRPTGRSSTYERPSRTHGDDGRRDAPATGSRSRGSAGCSRSRCGRCVGRRWHQPHHHAAADERRGGRRPTGSTHASRSCSGCWPRHRCRRRSPTRCSPRPPSSPPTSSASATAASASPASIVRAGIVIALPVRDARRPDRTPARDPCRRLGRSDRRPPSARSPRPSRCWSATQAIGRPLGLALDFLIAVVVAEEMPRNSRAYAVSVMAMASGLGAGIAVMALPLADIGESGLAARVPRHADVVDRRRRHRRRLPETHALRAPTRRQPTARPAALRGARDRGRLPPTCSWRRRASSRTATSRGSAATRRAADRAVHAHHRHAGRRSAWSSADASPTSAAAAHVIAVAHPDWRRRSIGGLVRRSAARRCGWRRSAAAFIGGIAYPAFAVYRAELFPTGNRGRAAGLLTAAALLGGIVGLLLVGPVARRRLAATAA